MTRRLALVVSGTVLCLSTVSWADRGTIAAEQGTSILLKARQAVSGDVTVTALALEGQRRFAFLPENGTLTPKVTATLELLFMLPDRYRQTSIDTGSATYAGFSGDLPLSGAKSLSPGVRIGVGTPGAEFVPRQRVVAARLLLGMLGITDGPLRLTARADATGAIRVTGPGEFDGFVDLDPATGAPRRVRYIDMVGFVSKGTSGPASGSAQGDGSAAGGRGGSSAGSSGSGRSFTSGPPERAEITISFDDRRPVDRVMIPHRITTRARSLATGDEETREELHVERVTVNPPLTVADIEREL